MPSLFEPRVAQALSLDNQLSLEKRNKAHYEKPDQLQSRKDHLTLSFCHGLTNFCTFLQADLIEAEFCEHVALPSSHFLLSRAPTLPGRLQSALPPQSIAGALHDAGRQDVCHNLTLPPRLSFWDTSGAMLMMTELLTDLTLLKTLLRICPPNFCSPEERATASKL